MEIITHKTKKDGAFIYVSGMPIATYTKYGNKHEIVFDKPIVEIQEVANMVYKYVSDNFR